MPVLATTLDLNNQNDPGEPLTVVFAYDQDVAIRWWGTDFPGLWTQVCFSQHGIQRPIDRG